MAQQWVRGAATGLALALLCSCSATDEPARPADPPRASAQLGDVVEVVDAETLVVDFGGDWQTVKLAGAELPQPDTCGYDHAMEATSSFAFVGRRLQVEAVEERRGGTPNLVRASQPAAEDDDWLMALVAAGAALPTGDPSEWDAPYGDAVETAAAEKRGLFSEKDDCTLGAQASEALEAVEAAENRVANTQPMTAAAITELVAAVTALKEAVRWAEGNAQDLRVRAHRTAGTTVVTTMRTSLKSARATLKKARAQRKKETAERLRREAEQRRILQELERQRKSPTPRATTTPTPRTTTTPTPRATTTPAPSATTTPQVRPRRTPRPHRRRDGSSASTAHRSPAPGAGRWVAGRGGPAEPAASLGLLGPGLAHWAPPRAAAPGQLLSWASWQYPMPSATGRG